MEQLGKYGFLRRDYLKKHKNFLYQVMLLQDTIGEHLLQVDEAAREREKKIDVKKLLRKSVKDWNRNMVRDLIKHQFQE